jgi:glycosyltransferase involved in cell wall biosynthesis
VHVCIVYDCLYPSTVGGAERWYRNVAERLAASGHDVTYLTLRQWEGAPPAVPGVRVLAVGPHMELYTRGRRRIVPPLVFGFGVLAHLARHGSRYDVVHTASFPYFPLVAAGLARRLGRFRLVVDWHELWTRDYWREYLGAIRGRAGWAVQLACLRIRQRAFCFSRLHEQRLRANGLEDVTLLEGQYAGGPRPTRSVPAEPVVVFAGRLIPEKRVQELVRAFVEARRRLPELRLEIYGDGPERPEVLRLIAAAGLEEWASAPGFVDDELVQMALRRALCLVLPSRREGYGLVVVESAAQGVPAVVVSGPDNAAAELVEEGVNGTLSPSAAPEALAAAILRVHDSGDALRASTADWFRRNAERLSLARSLELVLAAYAGL